MNDKTDKVKDPVIVRSGALNYPKSSVTGHINVLAVAEAFDNGLLRVKPSAETNVVKEIVSEASSIALNVQGTIVNPGVLWTWTLIGILLQLFTLGFPAVATYHWKWLRKGVAVPEYAYGCFISGSIAVIVGLLACGHVIEGSTTKHMFWPSPDGKARIQRILRLQMDCTVSGQHFPSFAILHHPENMVIRTSRLNNRDYK